MKWEWSFFKPEEVLSTRGLALYRKGTFRVENFAMDILTEYRKALGKPLFINHNGLTNRGWRDESENKKVGGVPASQHTAGLAFDISVYSMNLLDNLVFAARWSHERIKKRRPVEGVITEIGWRALGIYPNNNFIHHDCRSLASDNILIWNSAHDITMILNAEHFEASDETLREYLKIHLKIDNL